MFTLIALVVIVAIILGAVVTVKASRKEIAELATIETTEVVAQYHGLAAFYNVEDDIVAKGLACLEGFVICGSNKAIGSVGIQFEGVIHRAFEGDVFSTIESRNATDLTRGVDPEVYAKACAKLKLGYMETHTTVQRVTAVWCSDKKELAKATELADLLNVPVITKGFDKL